jgi:lipoyl-dependent peroxiredoxin
VSWVARSTEDTGGATSPEELIAAAHAACFSMALSSGLAKAGNPPDELHTTATVTFQPGDGITKIALAVEGRVPGLDAAAFEEAAQDAKENCPVSKALAGVPEITLDAKLAS